MCEFCKNEAESSEPRRGGAAGRFFQNETGSVMVEFALISTILIMLLVGIIEFGLIFNTQLSLENAAREGARYASLPANANDDSGTINYIKNLIPNIPITGSNIEISPTLRSLGEPVTIVITYQYNLPVTVGVLPESINLRATASMMQN